MCNCEFDTCVLVLNSVRISCAFSRICLGNYFKARKLTFVFRSNRQ